MFTCKSIESKIEDPKESQLRSANVLRDGQGKTYIRYPGDPRKYPVNRAR